MMMETTNNYTKKADKKGGTIQLVPKAVHTFLNEKRNRENKYLWEVLAEYLNEKFYADFQKYLDYTDTKLEVDNEKECEEQKTEENKS